MIKFGATDIDEMMKIMYLLDEIKGYSRSRTQPVMAWRRQIRIMPLRIISLCVGGAQEVEASRFTFEYNTSLMEQRGLNFT
eukprot:scaffold2436_cov80-Skeletonema_dohrnii-CCMP3373.AAC.5